MVTNEEDDGWGFDEDPQPNSSSREETPQVDATEGNDGWDFDDVAVAPAPAPPHKVAKPREAKRLGKRATHKGVHQGSSPSPPPPSPPRAPVISSPPPQPFAPAGRHTSTPAMPVISDTFKISVADDAVIDLTASALDELTKISNLQ
jgi:hypothetical protein